MTVTRVRDGMYRVEHDGRQDLVYVASSGRTWWAFWNGYTFEEEVAAARSAGTSPGAARPLAAQALTSPMPATVIKVLVTPGARVRAGDTVVVLEAMKMELPIRAPADGTVKAVNCREGDLVQPDQTLVDLE